MQSVLPPLCGLLLSGVLLGGCGLDRGIHQLRATHFPQLKEGGVSTDVQARALYLKATPDGRGLTAESIAAANDLLTTQGPIRRQVLTIIPLSPAGEQIAPRLVQALDAAGARSPQLGANKMNGEPESESAKEQTRQQQSWDIELVSEAIVVNVPDCTVAEPDLWTVEPYYAVGTLGCANQSNIAMMVSDPRDLIRPRSLAPSEGAIATSAMDRYLDGELNDLIDIDFSGDD